MTQLATAAAFALHERMVFRRPPRFPAGRRAVASVLHRRRATCLERSLVLQAWDAAHGSPRDVVIGVTSPSPEFRAHAWLDGEETCGHGEFVERVRIHPEGGELSHRS